MNWTDGAFSFRAHELLKQPPLRDHTAPLPFWVSLEVANPSDWQPECPVWEAGQTYELGDVVLDTRRPTFPLAGTVIAPDGTPAAGAVVRTGRNEAVTTGQQGRFEIPGMAAFEPVVLVATSSDGHLVGVLELTVDGQFEPDVWLAETGELSGEVIDADGNVQRHNRVCIEPRDLEFKPHIPAFVRTRTDADGRFSVAGLPSGLTYVVLVARPGNRLETVATVPLEPEESLDLGELVCRD